MSSMGAVGALRAAPRNILGRAQRASKRVSHTIGPIAALWTRLVWPVLAPGARVLKRVLLTATGFGWGVLAASVLAWIVGRAWGWQELTAVALVGFILLALAVLFVLGRSAYAITLDLATSHVVVGERAVGRIIVANPSARALLPAKIELPVGAGLAAFHLPRLAAGQEHDDLFTIPTQRRCVLSVGPVRSVRGDALGLFRRVVEWTDATDLFVHPKTVHLDGSSAGFIRDLEGLPTADLSNDDVSFHALREYVPGDDMRNVHWRSSARTGTIMVRQFEETRRSHLAIALSLNASDYASADEFELAVSACGSLGLQALSEEKQLTVLVQGRILAAATSKRLLDGLSGVEYSSSGADIVDLARTTGVSVPNASVVILLCGSTVAPGRIRSASSHIPQVVRVITVRCEVEAALSRRAIADTTVLTVGTLADLSPGMRRVNE